MRKVFVCVSLAALLVSGCGEFSGSGGGEGGRAEVNASKVTPEALRAAVSDERVKKFYEARGWQPVWNGKAAEELNAAFADAERHALRADGFVKQAGEGASEAEREASLTLAALDYAEALATGAVDPREIWEVYTLETNDAGIAEGLARAVEEGNIRQWLAGLAPSDPEYQALSEAYVQYRQRAAQEGGGDIQTGESIKPGSRDPRVPQIVEALRANGYMSAPDAGEGEGKAKQAPASDVYSSEVAEGVKRLQEDYGIKADGVVGPETLAALNTGAVERARILAVNLERRRWLARNPAATRIDVNTAAAQLSYIREGSVVDQRRVVVGQPEWETPQLGSPIVRLVANPPWNVPDSIAEEEILPKGEAYMRSQNISRKNGRLVQEAGPESALGLVKFDMSNQHAIYLHDTPAKSLFSSNDRHASHGCVRVEDALGFARLLAQHQDKLDAFEKALSSGDETGVELPDDIPVRLLYHSAYVDGGRVVFRTDPYGWDDRLAQKLGLGGQVRPKVTKHIEDVGP